MVIVILAVIHCSKSFVFTQPNIVIWHAELSVLLPLKLFLMYLKICITLK